MPRARKTTAETTATADTPSPPPIASRTSDWIRGDVKEPEFLKLIAEYPQRDRAWVYVYRTWPVIDSKKAGKYKYIQKVPCEQFTAEWLKRTWGTGDYKATLCDPILEGWNELAFCWFKFSFDVDAPPVLAPDTLLVDLPENAVMVSHLRMRGLLPNKDGQTMNDQMSAFFQRQLDELKAENRRLNEALQEAQKPEKEAAANSNHLLVDAIKTSNSIVAESIRSIRQQAPASKENESVLILAFKMMQDTQLAMAKMQAEHQRALMEAQKNNNPIHMLRDMNRTLKELKGESPEASDDWKSVARELAPAVLSIFAPRQPLPTRPQQAAATPAAIPQPANPPADTETPPEENEDMITGAIQTIGTQLFNALQQDKTGDEFAEMVVTMYGDDAYNQITKMGASGVLFAMRSHAAVWQMLAPYEEKLPEFIQQFMEYGQ